MVETHGVVDYDWEIGTFTKIEARSSVSTAMNVKTKIFFPFFFVPILTSSKYFPFFLFISYRNGIPFFINYFVSISN